MENVKTRSYACIIYPESCPDWKNKIAELKIRAVAILHDKDLKEGNDTEFKKEHVHLMICYDNTKPVSHAKALFSEIGGVGIEVVRSPIGMLNYFLHKNCPDKHEYSIDELVCFNGFDPYSLLKTADDRYSALKEIFHFCAQNRVYSFAGLMLYCSQNNDMWFRTLCDNSIAVREYLRSLSWSTKNHCLGSGQEEYSLSDERKALDLKEEDCS